MTVEKWADGAMFASEPIPFDVNTEGPRVTLLNATPMPLAAIAAMSKMYEGKTVHNLDEITDEDCHHYFEQMMKTKLQAPLEAVSFHFMLEGVTRSFTHQMVRQRTAVYAQESMRFAVKGDLLGETALPPSLMGVPFDDQALNIWCDTMAGLQQAYDSLINLGVPAEDARGLLPHNITTRLHYVTNLRALLDHGGNRLCTQAQFEWKTVWYGFIKAITNHSTCRGHEDAADSAACLLCDNWQFKRIATIFRPVCYLTGKCEFASVMDRNCSIRARVGANHEIGRPSELWAAPVQLRDPGASGDKVAKMGVTRDYETNEVVRVDAIDPAEWLNDPLAAR